MKWGTYNSDSNDDIYVFFFFFFFFKKWWLARNHSSLVFCEMMSSRVSRIIVTQSNLYSLVFFRVIQPISFLIEMVNIHLNTLTNNNTNILLYNMNINLVKKNMNINISYFRWGCAQGVVCTVTLTPVSSLIR